MMMEGSIPGMMIASVNQDTRAAAKIVYAGVKPVAREALRCAEIMLGHRYAKTRTGRVLFHVYREIMLEFAGDDERNSRPRTIFS